MSQETDNSGFVTRIDEVSSTTDESSSVTGSRGDEYGYASMRVPVELLDLLDRMKGEYNWQTRRAAIEAMVLLTADIGTNFQEDTGERWPEWHAALRASREIDHPKGD